MLNVYLFVFVLGCVNASDRKRAGSMRIDALSPEGFGRLIGDAGVLDQSLSDEHLQIDLDNISIIIDTDSVPIKLKKEEIQARISRIQELISKIEETEPGANHVVVEIKDRLDAVSRGTLPRPGSSASLATNPGDDDDPLLEGTGSDSKISFDAKKELKEIFMGICDNNPKLGKWTITIKTKNELDEAVAKTIQLTFEEEHSETASTGS